MLVALLILILFAGALSWIWGGFGAAIIGILLASVAGAIFGLAGFLTILFFGPVLIVALQGGIVGVAWLVLCVLIGVFIF